MMTACVRDNLDGDPALLAAARQALDKVPAAYVERERLIRSLAVIDPLQALEVAAANSDDPEQLTEVVRAAFASLSAMPDFAKAKALMLSIPSAPANASLPERSMVYVARRIWLPRSYANFKGQRTISFSTG
jgi:hypothetical protein